MKGKELSRFLSLVLRHAPETIGITLDLQGRTAVDEPRAKSKKAGKALDLVELHPAASRAGRVQRHPRAGATCVRIASMTCAL